MLRERVLGHSGLGVIPSDKPQEQGSRDAAKEIERIAGEVPVAFPKDQFDFISKEALKSLNAGLSKRSSFSGSPAVRKTFPNTKVLRTKGLCLRPNRR